MLAPRQAADAATETVAAIAEFMRGGSLEATRPNADDVAALQGRRCLPARTSISARCRRGRRRRWSSRRRASRAAGLEPVPHLAVRNFANADALARFLDRLTGEAGVRRLLVIAGDRAEPAGPFHGALEAIDSGLIARHGIAAIGISGYPDGHPRIADHELDRLLAAKLEAAAQTGLKVEIVTQFCLDAAPILAWVRAAARARDRSSGAHRARRPDQPDDADALCAALRRARLDPGARAQCRPDQAPARRRGAGRRSCAR